MRIFFELTTLHNIWGSRQAAYLSTLPFCQATIPRQATIPHLFALTMIAFIFNPRMPHSRACHQLDYEGKNDLIDDTPQLDECFFTFNCM